MVNFGICDHSVRTRIEERCYCMIVMLEAEPYRKGLLK